MDPNRTLRDLLDWAWARREHEDLGDVADLILDLDQWLSRGGFLPRRWDSAASPKLHSAAKDLREARDILARLLGEKAPSSMTGVPGAPVPSPFDPKKDSL